MSGLRTLTLSRPLRLGVAVIVVSSTLTGWAAPALGSHCEQAGAASHGTGRHASQAVDSSGPTWTEDPHHACRHCPPSDCSQVAHCAAAGVTAVVRAEANVAAIPSHVVAIASSAPQMHSIPTQPPTPPPQSLS